MTRFCGIVFLFIAASFICTAGPVAAAPAPGGGGTTATVDGSTVTITVNMDICCLPEDASQRSIFEPLVLAEIKAAQDEWNQALADLPAKGRYQIKVSFNARWLKKSEAWDNGYHHITFDFTSQSEIDAWESENEKLDHPLPDKYRSRIVDPDNLQNDDDDAPYKQQLAAFYTETSMAVGTFAHESGHLMGLGDDYFEQHGLGHRARDCLPGRAGEPGVGTLMCNSRTGIIDQDLADRLADILNNDGLLPQCWKGTMKISVASYKGPNRCTDSWTADMKVLVSDKGLASGSGTAHRASAVVCGHATPCPTPQMFTFGIAGESDRQSFRLRYSTTGATPPGACDYSAFSTVLPGFPKQRINTIPGVAADRAEGHYQVIEFFGTSTGSFDTALDCISCDTHIKKFQPDGQRR
jgi:hypothetical protein